MRHPHVTPLGARRLPAAARWSGAAMPLQAWLLALQREGAAQRAAQVLGVSARSRAVALATAREFHVVVEGEEGKLRVIYGKLQ